MIDILFLCPRKGNGGIVSWANKILDKFPDESYRLHPVDIAPNKDFTKFKGIDRLKYGIESYWTARKNVKKVLRENPQIRIMHITSGGGLGVIRDFFLALITKKQCKNILHCHFGNVTELSASKGVCGFFFRKALNLYNQIWVLDQRSADTLRQNVEWQNKVFITPNSIEVPSKCNLTPKQYKRIGYVGNIVPTKGIFELTSAVKNMSNDTELFIAGLGLKDDLETISKIAGEKLNKQIHLLGRLPNDEAVKLIETLDIICLPTYYPWEAFPISILEAMSRGKMVISCPRAAIPDMLSNDDGSMCGILVPEKNAQAITDAICWCQEHNSEADEMCQRAYEKVKSNYNENVVFDIYKSNYRAILQ